MNSPFAFALNDRVVVQEIDRPGKVAAIMVDGLGIQYLVNYWNDGERKSVWVQADELEAR